MTKLKLGTEISQSKDKSHALPRMGKLSTFLAAAAISFVAACGSSSSVKPNQTSLCPPMSEGIQQSDPRQENSNRKVMEEGDRYLLDENTVIELSDISVDGKAIFRIYDKTTKELLDMFELAKGESVEISIGGKKITLSVCSVTNGSTQDGKSAVVVTSEPLAPYVELIEDAGVPDALPQDSSPQDVAEQKDAEQQDTSLSDSGGQDSTPAQPCYPDTLVCDEENAPADSVVVVNDYDQGQTYTLTTVTEQPGDGTVRVTMSFDPHLRQCSYDFGTGMYNQCGYDWSCSTDNKMDRFVATHSVRIPFFGNEMTITDISADRGMYANSISLSWGLVNVILDVSGSLNADGRLIRLDDLGAGSCQAEQPAILSYFDCQGKRVENTNPEARVGFTNYKVLPDGTKFMIKVWRTAPGYTFGAQWADISVLASEIHLTDGSHPIITSPAIHTAGAFEYMNNWNVSVVSDGTGRIASITLTAPAFSTFKICK